MELLLPSEKIVLSIQEIKQTNKQRETINVHGNHNIRNETLTPIEVSGCFLKNCEYKEGRIFT